MDIKRTAADVWSAFASRDAAAIHEVLTDDVEWIAPKGNSTAVALGVTDHMIGKEAISSFLLNDMRRLFSNGLKIEPISVTAEGNRIVFEQTHTAILANGTAYMNDYVFIFEMVDGKVRRIREYMDTYSGHKMVFEGTQPRQIV
ncbi:nuclear transport factor 2 family protein [Sphingomonas psychrotolerans]|uniref:Nuclear transport factor 2 family protein n=1 Tax=Sphingomonas psychrotolerans TaxID=1327635 RepID=A0ABU3MZN0_9SPHN|nr:nuclear transport factor 2 family protein [Sphingomonas psychrotolerans]MDT8757755.1 nuclear transport factor 2 family protein [Sphingomonas psychrotolerans]